MLINQIAVFLENKQGKLSGLVNALADAGVNVQSLNIADTNDFGIVRMVTSDNELALNAIRSAGYTASSVDLVGVEVDDAPGSLARFLAVLAEEGIAIEYIYSYSFKEGRTLILFKTSEVERAQSILNKHKL